MATPNEAKKIYEEVKETLESIEVVIDDFFEQLSEKFQAALQELETIEKQIASGTLSPKQFENDIDNLEDSLPDLSALESAVETAASEVDVTPGFTPK